MWQVALVFKKNKKKTSQTSCLKYFQNVVETFPITCFRIFLLNQYRKLYFTKILRRKSVHVTGCIGVEEIPKKRPKHLAWNISKFWWRPFLSHVMVFFMFNQCRILYFTVIIRRNSVHVTGCIGVEEIPKTSQTSSLKYFQIVVETFPITCVSIFRVESV